MPERLSTEQIHERLARSPEWVLGNQQNQIERTFKLKTFSAAISFVNQVAEISEAMNHHPDIDIRWNRVKLTLSTHSAGGLTSLDFEAALKFDLSFLD